jgi:hypothetical protein
MRTTPIMTMTKPIGEEDQQAAAFDACQDLLGPGPDEEPGEGADT